MIQVILFDLGGVLVDFAGFRRLEVLAPAGMSPEDIRRRWAESSCVRDFELGLVQSSSFAELFVGEWSLECSPGEFLEEFATWPQGLFPGTHELLDELCADYRLACLSNTNEVHWPALTRMLDGRMERVFASHQLGLLKPDPAVFASVVAELGVPPADILFLDDAPANVSAAISCGLQAAVVPEASALGDLLASLGVSPDGSRSGSVSRSRGRTRSG